MSSNFIENSVLEALIAKLSKFHDQLNNMHKILLIFENLIFFRNYLHVILAQNLLAAHWVSPYNFCWNKPPFNAILNAFKTLKFILYGALVIVVHRIPF